MLTITKTTTAANIAAVCTTSKEAKSYFKELISAGIERDAARALIAAAVELIKGAREEDRAAAAVARTERDAARAWYRDGRKEMRAVFVQFVKSPEFKAAAKGCKFNGSEIDFINKYYPIVTANGAPVRVVSVDVDGVIFRRYRFVDLTRAGAYRAIFDKCLNSIYKERTGEFIQRRGR